MSDKEIRQFKRRPADNTGILSLIMCRLYPIIFHSILRKGYRIMAEMLELKPDDEVLDVACGSGIFMQQYLAGVRKIAGLDINEIQINMAQKRNRDRIGLGTAEIVLGDSAELPWQDNTFTAVTCDCLHCFERPELSVNEMYRVLKRGGRAVIVISYNADEAEARKIEQKGIICVWTEDELTAMMESAGFTLTSIDRTFAQKGGLIVKVVK